MVLIQDDYNHTIINLLKDDSNNKMKGNLTTKVKKNVTDALKEVESRGDLSSAQRKSLVNTYSIPLHLYGIPKTHKNGSPLPSSPKRTGWQNILPAYSNL